MAIEAIHSYEIFDLNEGAEGWFLAAAFISESVLLIQRINSFAPLNEGRNI